MAAILCTGWATKRGALKKNWKRRYFVLRNDLTLSYYKDGWSPNSKPQGVITIDPTMTFAMGANCAEIDWPACSSETTRFQLTTPARTFYLFCDTPEASMGWVTKIKQLSSQGANPAHKQVQSDVSPQEAEALHNKVKMLARLEENQYCFDCGTRGVQPWASWNLGVFLCWRCAGIHRSLGLHVSKAKSITLDTWPADHVASLERQGNKAGVAYWEASLPSDFERPQEKAELDRFISQKYVARKWAAAERRQSMARAAAAHETHEETRRTTNPFAGSDTEDDSDGDTFVADFSSHHIVTAPPAPAPTAAAAPDATAQPAAAAAGRRPTGPIVVAASTRAAAADPMADHHW